jgi:hypothetical protein
VSVVSSLLGGCWTTEGDIETLLLFFYEVVLLNFAERLFIFAFGYTAYYLLAKCAFLKTVESHKAPDALFESSVQSLCP